MTASYCTPLAAVVIPRAVPFHDEWITQTPLLDPAGPGIAHLMPCGSAEMARRNGARLPTAADMLALHLLAVEQGTEIEPVTLPDHHWRALGYVPGDPRMGCREWCDYADAEELSRVAALGPLGDRVTANVKKMWLALLGALAGWWVPDVGLYDRSRSGPGFIQLGAHVEHAAGRVVNGVQIGGQVDYSSGTLLIWDRDPAAVPDTDPAPTLPTGAAT